MQKTIIFSDGSSRGNPGPGGFGSILFFEEDGVSKVVELGGREEKTTNNRMELMGALETIRLAESIGIKEVTVHTDSSYVVNSLTKWIWSWVKNDWQTKDGKSVSNQDIFECFFEILPLIKVHFVLVKGHSGVIENERCDQIATSFADDVSTELFNGNRKDYNIILDTKKVSKGTKNKGKAYSYVSSVEGIIEIHKTWGECEKRVKGKKARFKKSLSKIDEEKIVKEFKN